MKKLIKGKLIILLVMLLGFIYFFRSVSSKVNIENTNKSHKVSIASDIEMKAVSINLKYENTDINLSKPIYVENNRYYIPMTEMLNKMNGNILVKGNNISLSAAGSNVIVDNSKDEFIKDGKVLKLKQKLINDGSSLYITMFDFTKMFDLKVQWNIKDNTLLLYKNRENKDVISTVTNGKPALIRLEDIAAGGRYNSEEALEKLRIVSDYLYKEGIPFHVAWVPRYVNPANNVDNDLVKSYSMYNADFIFTMDYFIDKGGVVGLHGYTHQYGKMESVEGTEFYRKLGDEIPKDIQYAEDRLNRAIEAAKQLKIQYEFFEVPHYAILYPQLESVEKKFDYIYEPYSEDGGETESKSIVCKHKYGKTIKYIPTPLNYIDGKADCNNMLKKIDSLNKNLIASFFYHPYIEFEDIQIFKTEDGYPYYKYSNESVLHQIVNRLKGHGFTFYKINDLK